MRRFISSDWHLGVGQSMLEDEHFDCLYYMLEKAVDNKCTHFDILGDLLHNRVSFGFRLAPRIGKFFEDVLSTKMKVTIMAGNHDVYGTVSRAASNLRYINLPSGINIVDTIQTDSDGITWVPWLFPGEMIPEGGKVIFAHLAINGFKLHPKKLEEHGIEIPKSKVPIYTGHFHSSQVAGMVRYLGSIGHFNWSDANEIKCAYILSPDFGVDIAVELNSKFTNLIKIDYDSLNSLQITNKCRITVTGVPKGEEDLVAKALMNQGATSVECLSKEDMVDAVVADTLTKGLSVEEAVEEQIGVHAMKDELMEFHRIINK